MFKFKDTVDIAALILYIEYQLCKYYISAEQIVITVSNKLVVNY